MEALIDRALELDEAWDEGSIHSFLITYEMSRPGASGDPAAGPKCTSSAKELARGRHAGPYVSYAESVCVEKQDAAQFHQLLEQALAVDPHAHIRIPPRESRLPAPRALVAGPRR